MSCTKQCRTVPCNAMKYCTSYSTILQYCAIRAPTTRTQYCIAHHISAFASAGYTWLLPTGGLQWDTAPYQLSVKPKCPAACSLLLKCSTHSAQATLLLLYQMVCHCIGPLKLFSGPLLPTFGEPQLSLFKQGSSVPSKVPNIFILAYILCQNVSPKNCTPLTRLWSLLPWNYDYDKDHHHRPTCIFQKCAMCYPGPVLHFFNADFVAIIFTIKADGVMSQYRGHRPPGRGRVSPLVINF